MKHWIMIAGLLFLLTGCSAGGSGDTAVPSATKNTGASVTTAVPTQSSTEAAPKFEDVMVVDNDQCAIYIRELWEDPVWGWSLRVELENKSDSKTYMFSLASASINGVQADPVFATEVAPGKKAKEVLHVQDATIAKQDIGPYSDVELQFRVYDSDQWQDPPVATPTIHVYPYGAENAEAFVRQPQPGDTVLADTEAATVTVTGFAEDPIWGFTAEVFLLNKTDKNLMFTVEDASVNGYMAEPLFARTVDAGNCAFDGIAWSDQTLEELQIGEVETLEFTLRVYDADNWSEEDVLNVPVMLKTKEE